MVSIMPKQNPKIEVDAQVIEDLRSIQKFLAIQRTLLVKYQGQLPADDHDGEGPRASLGRAIEKLNATLHNVMDARSFLTPAGLAPGELSDMRSSACHELSQRDTWNFDDLYERDVPDGDGVES